MAKSIASINSLLVSLKTVNNALLIKLQQLGFNTNLTLGSEQEYTVKTLVHAIDTLAIQFLTITANRNQFIQRTSYNERMEIESCLNSLLSCLQQTKQELADFDQTDYQCDQSLALFYTSKNNEQRCLKLLDAVHFIDLIKPYCRMLEMIIAQERIHALSAVLETLLSKENAAQAEKDNELTEEQSNALELSQYLIRQAL
ncbi:MAG: hypothetical protein DIZ80_12105 [endosymbiont of Galathealinum brachiosum]|uniref:Uncharacterized protein n=1 Tax=endosymbiont of Galathealinum brachiosum TaxID=2200906 RepID=A0A370DDM0_9GAMM|nr:MAG: hypothetical protein DIZ80_12105 [endosymbiont of Galathealinum brachiosum]